MDSSAAPAGPAVDVIVVGAGLAGLVATDELVAAGKRVLVLDQAPEADLGGQAWWSLGGLFLVDTPQQRRLRVKDSFDLAWQDWQGSAGWDRLDDEDSWAQRWGRAYVEFAAGEKREWLESKGIRLTAMVGWAERGGSRADGHGNSVPRFHVAWGAGTGVVGPFVERARASDQVTFAFRHRVDELVVTDGAVTGVRGSVLAPSTAERGAPAPTEVVGQFEFAAPAVLVSSGGIGGNHELVRRFWPERLGTPPRQMVTGVPDYVDGRMLDITEAGGARLVNRDRMWHYTEGIQNWDPIWTGHGIRILPGPSPLWFDALGRLLPAPCLPGYDTLATLRHLRTTPDLVEHDHSWFLLTQKMIEKEFALSGSEQNPDLVSGKIGQVLKTRLGRGAPGPVEAFKEHGADFLVGDDLDALVGRMNDLVGQDLLDPAGIRRQVEARDREMDNAFSKDAQIMGIHNARRSMADKLGRVSAPHRVLDESAGPLIAVRLHVLTRKSLGGVQTDLGSRALAADGTAVPGLYAAGEVAGFGGGGVHGYNALEGTFLGGCLFSGRAAGRTIAADIA